jgi:hypothetical protein
MKNSFYNRYEEVHHRYQSRRCRQSGDALSHALLINGYVTIQGWYEACDIGSMKAAIPNLTQMYSEPQSPSVYSLHDARKVPAFAPFFWDSRIIRLIETLFEKPAKVVRDWAQVGVQPIALTGAAGTLHVWDSRMLHRHVPASCGERHMLEMVFSEDSEI